MLQILNLKFTIGHFADNHIKFHPALRRVLLKFKKKEKKINQIVY